MLYQPKGGPEFVVKGLRAVANNIQAAALGRTFGAKCRNDYVPAGFDRMGNLSYVGYSVARIGEEVEDGAVMPQIELMTGKGYCPYVAAEPVDPDCVCTERRHNNRLLGFKTTSTLIQINRMHDRIYNACAIL